MPTDARAATALPSRDPFHFSRPPAAEPTTLGEQDRFILDIFRLLRLFRERYDEALLARAEALAERRLGPAADALMGAAVMLDNELRCRGATAYVSGDPGDPGADDVEATFLALLDAAAERAEAVAARTAAALGVDDHRLVTPMAARLVALAARPDDMHKRSAPASQATATTKLTSRTMFE